MREPHQGGVRWPAYRSRRIRRNAPPPRSLRKSGELHRLIVAHIVGGAAIERTIQRQFDRPRRCLRPGTAVFQKTRQRPPTHVNIDRGDAIAGLQKRDCYIDRQSRFAGAALLVAEDDHMGASEVRRVEFFGHQDNLGPKRYRAAATKIRYLIGDSCKSSLDAPAFAAAPKRASRYRELKPLAPPCGRCRLGGGRPLGCALYAPFSPPHKSRTRQRYRCSPIVLAPAPPRLRPPARHLGRETAASGGQRRRQASRDRRSTASAAPDRRAAMSASRRPRRAVFGRSYANGRMSREGSPHRAARSKNQRYRRSRPNPPQSPRRSRKRLREQGSARGARAWRAKGLPRAWQIPPEGRQWESWRATPCGAPAAAADRPASPDAEAHQTKDRQRRSMPLLRTAAETRHVLHRRRAALHPPQSPQQRPPALVRLRAGPPPQLAAPAADRHDGRRGMAPPSASRHRRAAVARAPQRRVRAESEPRAAQAPHCVSIPARPSAADAGLHSARSGCRRLPPSAWAPFRARARRGRRAQSPTPPTSRRSPHRR